MKKTVVVLGANGMLGQALVPELDEEFRVVSHVRAEADLRDAPGLRERIRGHAPDFVVNAAAMTAVDGCEDDPDTAYAVNGLGARNAAVAATEAGAALLQVSTDFVFDGEKGEAYLEYDEPRPLSVYGDSKLWGEKLVRDHGDRFFIVRTQWLYGAGGRNFVDTIVGRAREGHPLRIVDDQVGCPTSTRELARAIRRILVEGAYGVYHASGLGSCSWFDFARAAVERAGIEGASVEPMPSSELERPARRPADSRLRNYHMELTFGDPMRPWEEALEEYLREKQVA